MSKKNKIEKLDPKTDGASPDVVADNIERLREIFPEVFADGAIDFDALKETLGEYVDDREERYSFTWHGKARARQIAQMPSTGTLRPCPEESVNWDTTKNIFIEGDNLEVLKLLQKSYHRKVKMIYIDPPYNTGKEFIYPDKWQDNLDTYLRYTGQVDDEGFKLSANAETSGRYHTNWLNMMYPRLKLARSLLRDDGSIFISIDDHESANLRKLCDEVFGEENFVANIVWQKKYAVSADDPGIASMHDHILVYRRSDAFTRILFPRTEKQNTRYTNPDDDHRGRWSSDNYVSNKSKEERPTLWYSITHPADGREVWPEESAVWRYSREKHEQIAAEGRLYWGPNLSYDKPRLKRYLSEVQDGVVPPTWWPFDEAGHNDEAQKETGKLIGKKQFDTPKPIRLLQRILQIGCCPEEGDLVLDFFAGSGAMGEAVYRKNMESGGRARFVLIQLPELTTGAYATIAEITKARLREASKTIGDDASGTLPGIQANADGVDLGFKVFKLASSNIKPWDADFDSMADDLVEAIDNIKSDRSEDDVLYELLLKYGLDLAIPTETRTIEKRSVTVIGAGALIVCLADDITLEVVAGIAALKDELKPEVMRVVFKDSGFKDDVAKTNAAQILKQAGIDDVKSL